MGRGGGGLPLRSSEPHPVPDLVAELLEGVLHECWRAWEGRVAGAEDWAVTQGCMGAGEEVRVVSGRVGV